MTARGSLAYYLAAWVCGCFFMSVTIWFGNEMHLTESPTPSLFLYIYFLSLMFGAITVLLFGFFLRSAARLLRWKRTWHWLAGGAVLAPILIALLEMIASSQPIRGSSWRAWIFIPVSGPYFISGSHHWMPLLAAPAGAATAWVLSRIHHAFAASSSNPTA
jgi:hypothetical protein